MSNNSQEVLEVEKTARERTRVISPRPSARTQGIRLPRDRRQDYKQHYERFVMTVYQTVKNNKVKNPDFDIGRAGCLNLPQSSFPKLAARQPLTDIDIEAEIQQVLLASSKGFPNPKYKILKNFLNNYQEYKKKNQVEEMSMLGLQVKKLDCPNGRRLSAKKFQIAQSVDAETEMKQSVIQGAQTQRKPTLLLECRGYSTRRQPYISTKLTTKKNSVDEETELDLEIDIRQRELIISKMQMAERVEKEPRPASLPMSNTKYGYYHEKMKGKWKFGHADNVNTIYENKMVSYREFIFKVHAAHNVYMDLTKRDDQSGFTLKSDAKLKAWIGPGNNSLLVRGLIKRRFWWHISDQRCTDCNFVWSQIKINDVFKKQPSSKSQQRKQITEDSEDEEKPRKQIVKRKKQQYREDHIGKILMASDQKLFKQYSLKYEAKNPQKISHKKQHLGKPLLEITDNSRFLMHNHIENNFFLGNKKAMFHNMKQYYQLTQKNVFDMLPLTFHIKNGIKCAQYKRFLHYHKKRATYIKKQEKAVQQGQTIKKPMRNIWIVKPGQLSNRGNGITVIDQVYQLNKIIGKKEQHNNGTAKTYIVQLYLDRPLLYNRRKFDIRHYMLITNLYGVMRGYWYSEGYVRTSSYEFDVFNFDREIHLTNDAVQKYTPAYGRYEAGNKLSYTELQRYLDTTYPNKHYSFASDIFPKMRDIGRDAVRSAYLKLSPNNLEHNFEILGLDFMIDQNFKPWLIQINTNPCLQLSCPLLQRIIPLMVEQSLRLSLDIVFPPPCHYSNTTKHLAPDMSLENLKYELIFDSLTDGDSLRHLYSNIKLSKLMDEIGEVSDDEEYADDGHEVKLQDVS